jgi:LytS/YehU family sensor histidine kinase
MDNEEFQAALQIAARNRRTKMKEMAGCLTMIFGMISMVVLLAVLMTLPTMLIWNAIVPDITKNALTELSFWQAFGLNFLCGILFKSSGSATKSE